MFASNRTRLPGRARPGHHARPARPAYRARRAARVAAVLVTLAGLALGVAGLTGSAAQAASDRATVRISGLDTQLTAGRADAFLVTVRNDSKKVFTNVRRVFTIQLDGLTTDGVSMSRGGVTLSKAGSGHGQVVLADPVIIALSGKNITPTAAWQYQILFTSSAPEGKAVVTVSIYTGNELIASTDTQTSVINNNPGTPTAAPTDGATTTPTNPAANASAGTSAGATPGASSTAGAPIAGGANGGQPPLDPLPADQASADSGQGVPGLFYAFGVALLAAGGVIIWLLVRRPEPQTADAYPTNYPPTGYTPIAHPPRLAGFATSSFPASSFPASPTRPSAGTGTGPVLYPTSILPAVGSPLPRRHPAEPGPASTGFSAGPPPAADPWAGIGPDVHMTTPAPIDHPIDITRDFGTGVGPVSGAGPVSGGSVGPVSGADPINGDGPRPTGPVQ